MQRRASFSMPRAPGRAWATAAPRGGTARRRSDSGEAPLPQQRPGGASGAAPSPLGETAERFAPSAVPSAATRGGGSGTGGGIGGGEAPLGSEDGGDVDFGALTALTPAEVTAICERHFEQLALHFSLGFRSFYLSAPLLLYGAGAVPFIAGSVFITGWLLYVDAGSLS